MGWGASESSPGPGAAFSLPAGTGRGDPRPICINPTARSRADERNTRVTRSSLVHRLQAAGRCRRVAWALAPALLLLPGAAHAAALDQFSVQVLAQSGGSTPGFHPIGQLEPGHSPPLFEIGRMNNHGQIALVTETQESQGRPVLGILSNGQTISLLADTGTEVAGLGNSYGFWTVGPKDQNSNVLMSTWTTAPHGITGVLLWQQGQLVPVILLGQDLPGGGQFRGWFVDTGPPNALGQYPFAVGFTENGKIGSGAYLVGADGKLSLIARTGMTTPLGALTGISPWLSEREELRHQIRKLLPHPRLL
jgi:hypothetical protein